MPTTNYVWHHSSLLAVVAATLSLTTGRGLSIVSQSLPPRELCTSSAPKITFFGSTPTSHCHFSNLKGFTLMSSLIKYSGNNNLVGQSSLLPLLCSFSSTVTIGHIDAISTFEMDQVERILDANTIQLKKKGVVRLAMVRMPSTSSSGNFQFPECFPYSPSYKIRQLIPKSTVVRIQTVRNASSSNKNNPPTVILVRDKDSVVVNRELVKAGFAKVINQSSLSTGTTEPSSLVDRNELLTLQNRAQVEGLGIFSRCDADSFKSGDGGGISKIPVVDAQFEPMERTTETVFTDDGGKQYLRIETIKDTSPPANPGDIKGCSDFKTYEDSLTWFEKYLPFYGDVAKLDRDGDGVPCPGLPHTSNRDMYRMKVPKTTKVR
jgi:endonuclease YncB( thermonuclease family)